MLAALVSIFLCMLAIGVARPAFAGPPFETDDPEPVNFHKIEIDVAQGRQGEPAATGVVWEIDYGALRNAEISIGGQPGETEFAGAFRFIPESKHFPEVSVLPAFAIKSDGERELFIPFWAQKTIGAWTIFGGGGISRGGEFTGLTVMRNFRSGSSVGLEVYHASQHDPIVPVPSRIGLGYIAQQGPSHALTFWIGRQFQPRPSYYFYVGIQRILGPR